MQKLEVGQTLWFETNAMANKYAYFAVTVEKTGRKWAEVSGGTLCRARLAADTLEVHGPVCVLGQCFLSEHALHEHRAVARNWSDLRRSLSGAPPAGLTADALHEAMRLLGIAPEELANTPKKDTP